MGNVTSNSSSPDSPNEEDTSDAAIWPSTLDKEKVVDALKQKGLCVSESELSAILRKHDSCLAAVSDAIERGTARRVVKGQDPRSSGSSGKKRPQENVLPQLLSNTSSTSSGKISQKRSRTAAGGGDSTEISSAAVNASAARLARGERPLKRPATMRGFASFANGGGLGGGGGGEKGRSGGGAVAPTPLERLFSFKGTGSTGGQKDARDNNSTESEERQESTVVTVDADNQHVLLPLQQGSSPRRRLGRSRGFIATKGSAKIAPPAVMSEGARSRTFVTVQADLTAGDIEDTIMAGLAQGVGKSEEQKEEIARFLNKELRLFPLGTGRREGIDKDLTRCIAGVLEDLAERPNVRNGAQLISHKVHETRKTIRDLYSTVARQYQDLIDKGKKQDERVRTDNSSNNSRAGSAGDNSVRSPLPRDPTCGAAWLAPGSVNQAQRSNRLDQQSPVPPRRLQQHQQHQPAMAKTPSGNGLGALAFGLGGGGDASSLWRISRRGGGGSDRAARVDPSPSASGGGLSTAEQQPMSKEERHFWQSLDLCYTALDNATFVREEEEWLQHQLEVGRQKKEEVEEDDADQLRQHQDAVKAAEGVVKAAEEKVEAATQAIVAEHVGAATKDEALRSLIDCVQTACGPTEGYELLGDRGRAKLMEESARASLQTNSTRLAHMTHATAISAVLCNYMFGDLLETAEDMLKKARQKRVSKQQVLKSNATAVLDHLTKALDYHITRRMSADEDVRQSTEKFEHNAKFFGEHSAKAQKFKAILDDMQAYVNDSIRKTDHIVSKMRLLVLRMRPELSAEDCNTLTKDASQCFAQCKAKVTKYSGGRNIDVAGPMSMLESALDAFSPTSKWNGDP